MSIFLLTCLRLRWARIELATLGLWDPRAASCAIIARADLQWHRRAVWWSQPMIREHYLTISCVTFSSIGWAFSRHPEVWSSNPPWVQSHLALPAALSSLEQPRSDIVVPCDDRSHLGHWFGNIIWQCYAQILAQLAGHRFPTQRSGVQTSLSAITTRSFRIRITEVCRHRRALSPCGQSPMDVWSITLATRWQCPATPVFRIKSITRWDHLGHWLGEYYLTMSCASFGSVGGASSYHPEVRSSNPAECNHSLSPTTWDPPNEQRMYD